jgi:excisionase family DNA binding protein
MPKTEPDLSDFLTTKEVSELYGVSQVEVQKAIKKGNLQAQKIGYFYVLWRHNLPGNFPSS